MRRLTSIRDARSAIQNLTGFIFAALIVCQLASTPAHAVNRYFDSASSGSTWDNGTTANWGTVSGGPYTSLFGAGNSAFFEGTGGSVSVAGAGVTAFSLEFNSAGYTIGGPGTITINGTTDPRINALQSATINAPISISNVPQTWAVASGKTLTLGGGVNATVANQNFGLGGNGNYIFNGSIGSNVGSVLFNSGAGVTTTATFNAANTFTGQLWLGNNGNSSTLNFSDVNQLGSGVGANFIAIQSDSLLRYTGATSGTVSGRQIYWNSGAATIDVSNAAGNLTLDYSTAGATRNQALTKLGAGTLTLSAGASSETITGSVAVNNGTLILRSGSAGTGNFYTAPTNVSSGSTLNSERTIAGFGNRSAIMGNAITGSGTININNTANTAGTTDGGWTTIGVASGLTMSGTININSGVFSRDNTSADNINTTATVNVAANAAFGAGRGGNSTIGALNGAGDVGAFWSGANTGSITIGNGDGSGSFSGTLRGNGGATDGSINGGILNVIKTGAGTQTLTGANIYTGTTTVRGGTLAVSGSGSLSNTAISYTGAAFGSQLNVSSVNGLTGTTSLAVNSANATAILGSANNFTGATNLTAGTLRLADGGAIASSALTINNASGAMTLQLRNDSDTTFTSSGNITGFGNGGVYTFDVNQLTGAGSNKTLTVGNLSVSSGQSPTLYITGGNGYRLGLGNVTSPGAYNLTLSPNTANVSVGNVTLGTAGAQNLDLSGSLATGNNTIGAIAGNFDLHQIGVSNWTLTAASTFTGTVWPGNSSGGGSLSFSAVNQLGGVASTTSDFIAIQNNSTLRYTGTGAESATARDLYWNSGAATIDITSGTGNLQLNITGGTRDQTFTKSGAGQLTLSKSIVSNEATGSTWNITGGVVEFNQNNANAINRFTGQVIGAAGTQIKVSGSGYVGNDNLTAIWGGNRASLDVSGTASFDLRGQGVTIDGLTGTSAVANSFASGTNTLIVGAANGSGSFSGVIKQTAPTGFATSGTPIVALTKIGTGTQTLSGTSTYTGATTVNAGTLRLDFAAGGTSNILSASTPLSLGGGTLEILGGAGEADTQTFAGVSGAGGTLQLTQNGATSVNATLGAITAAGSLNFAGATTTMAGIGNSTAGATNFITSTTTTGNNGSTRLGGHLWNGTDWASTALDGAATTYVVQWQGAYTDRYNGTTPGPVAIPTGTPTAEVRILQAGSGFTNNTLAASATINSLLMSAAGNSATVDMSSNTLTVGNGAAAVGAVAIGSGANSLTIGTTPGAGAGTLTAGSSGASTLVLNNQNAASTLTVNSVISNGASSSVALQTNGQVALNGVSTFTGGTTIGSGTLQIGAAGQLGSGAYAGAIANSGMLRYSSSAAQTLSGAITGTGGITKDTNSSTLTVSNTGTNYTGATVVDSGVFVLSATGTVLYASPTTVNSGGTFRLAGAANAEHGGWVGNALTLNNGSTLDKTNIGYDTINFGNVTVNGTVSMNITNNGSSNQLFIGNSGVGLTGSGIINLTNTGTSTTGLTFRSGMHPTRFDGDLNVSGGVVNVGSGASTVLDNTDVTLTGAILNLNGAFSASASPASVKSLSGNAASTAALGGQTLTLGTNNGTGGAFAGVITGTGLVIKTGSGTQSLSGTGSTVSQLTVNEGTLNVTGGTIADSGFLITGNVANNAPTTYNQSGGTVTATTGAYFANQTGSGTSTVNISGGTFNGVTNTYIGVRGNANMTVSGASTIVNLGAQFATGHTSATGNGLSTYTQTDGTVSYGASGAFLANSAGSAVTFDVSGGTFTGGSTFFGATRGDSVSTISSAGSVNLTGTTWQMIHGTSAGIRSTLNLGGGAGTFSGGTSILDGGTSGVVKANAITTANNGTAILNFNGGTYQATAAGTVLAATAGFSINVKEAGGILDNNGNAITISQALLHGGSAAIDGGMLFKGSGTTTLTSAGYSYTGATTVRSGALVMNTNELANTSGYTVNDTLTGSSNTRLQFTGGFTGNRTGVGGATLRDISPITVANQGSGTTTIDVNSTSAAWISGLATLNKGVTLKSTGAGIRAGFMTFSGPGAGAGNDTLIFDATGSPVAGSNWNTYEPVGPYTTQPNTFTGNVRFTGGLTVLQNKTYSNAAFTDLIIPSTASVTIDSGSTMQLAWGTESFDGLNGGGTLNLNASGGAQTVTIGVSGGGGNFSGTIADNGAVLTLTKNGGGTQTFSGTNTYTGITTVNAGTLILTGTASNTTSADTLVNDGQLHLGKTAGLNAIAGNNLYVGDGSGAAASAIIKLLDSNQIPNTTDVTIYSDGKFDLNGRDETINNLLDGAPAGGTVDGTSGTPTFTVQGGSFSGVITDTAGTLKLVKSSSNNLQLAGANTYAGATDIQAGILAIGSGNDRLPTTTTVTLGNGTTSGKLRLAELSSPTARNQTISGLLTSGTGTTNRVVGGAATNSVLTVNIAGSNTYDGFLGGPSTNENRLALTKTGVGTLTLTANNTYIGVTNVNQGTLRVNGTHTGGGLYTVANGATLGGSGTISAAVNILAGGITSPGNSPGTLTLASLDYDIGAVHDWEVNGAFTNDIMNVTGLLNFDGPMTINVYNLGVTSEIQPSMQFVVWDYGTVAGFNPLNFTIADGGGFIVSGASVFDNGSQIMITGLMSVPEPSTWVLAIVGLVGLGLVGWRRRRCRG